MIQVIETRKVPDSILLTGTSGQDLVKAGFLAIQALNCQTPNGHKPCLECSSCKKIQAGLHPDIIHLQLPEDKKEISIDQIRQMETRLQVKPNEGGWRMVLISQAQKMNVQAQNALLKTLEEPPGMTFFILTAPDGTGFLPTIVSRCRQIYFPSPGAEQLADFLADTHGVDRNEALTAIKITGKDREKAMQLLNLSPTSENKKIHREKSKEASEATDWKAMKTWILDQMEFLILPPADAAHRILFTSEALSRREENLPLCLMILGSFFRDMGIYLDYPQGIIHKDRIRFFERVSQQISRKQVLEFLDLFHETEKRLHSNASARLTLERFCLKLAA